MERVEEEIIIDEALITDSEDESMDLVDPPRARSRRPETGDEHGIQLDPSNDPLYNLEGQERIPTTADIRHFFERTAEGSVCNYCKYVSYIRKFIHLLMMTHLPQEDSRYRPRSLGTNVHK